MSLSSHPSDSPELKPIYTLISTGDLLLSSLYQKNVVKNGVIETDTEKGRMSVSVVALPPEDTRSGVQKFWDKIRRKVRTEDSLPPTPLAIQPRLYADEFIPGIHVQLMGHMPYAVLEHETRYGISVEIPGGLVVGEWEEFSGPADTGILNLGIKTTEVGRRRKSYAVVVRTDDGQPLLRQKIQSSHIPVFQEMLKGFKPVDGTGNGRAFIDRRSTVMKSRPTSGELGKTQENPAEEESLIFTSLNENVGVGVISDNKGKVQVVVYEVTEKEIREIIEEPREFNLVGVGSGVDNVLRGGGSLTMGGGLKGAGFSAGETKFGTKQSRKVDTKGVRIEKPVAAFELVLVGEMLGKAMEMIEETPEA